MTPHETGSTATPGDARAPAPLTRTFGPQGPTLGDLTDAYLQDYEVRQFRSLSTARGRVAHLAACFGRAARVAALTTDQIRQYQLARRARVHTLTEATSDDATTALDLLTAVESPLVRVTADAASDTVAVYETATARGATVVIPPARTANVSGHGRRSPARDRTITVVKQLGRRRWKKASGYHRQGRVENTCFRDTSIIGDGLRARSPAGQGSEVVLGCEILKWLGPWRASFNSCTNAPQRPGRHPTASPAACVVRDCSAAVETRCGRSSQNRSATGASRISEPLPALRGSVEPAIGSPVCTYRSSAWLVVSPMSTHRPVQE